jgi:hypothetical protein
MSAALFCSRESKDGRRSSHESTLTAVDISADDVQQMVDCPLMENRQVS